MGNRNADGKSDEGSIMQKILVEDTEANLIRLYFVSDALVIPIC